MIKWGNKTFLFRDPDIGLYLAGRMFELTGNYKLVFVMLAILSAMMIGLNLTLRPVAAKGREPVRWR